MEEVNRFFDHLFIPHTLRPGDLFVELGAHQGRALEASRLVDVVSTAFFVLVEPTLDSQQVLRDKFPQPNVVVDPRCVVGDDRTTVDFFVETEDRRERRGHGNGNSLTEAFTPQAVKISVPSVSLRELLDHYKARFGVSRVRYLWLNIEGEELQALKTDLSDVDYISCEFHPGKTGVVTEDFLSSQVKSHKTVQLARQGEPYNIWLGQNQSLIS